MNNQAAVSAVHVFDAPARSYLTLASASDHEVDDYLASEEARAAGELAAFLHVLEFGPVRQLLKPSLSSTAHVICATARGGLGGPHRRWRTCRTGITKFLLGNVAEEVLHVAHRDVLGVPPA